MSSQPHSAATAAVPIYGSTSATTTNTATTMMADPRNEANHGGDATMTQTFSSEDDPILQHRTSLNVVISENSNHTKTNDTTLLTTTATAATKSSPPYHPPSETAMMYNHHTNHNTDNNNNNTIPSQPPQPQPPQLLESQPSSPTLQPPPSLSSSNTAAAAATSSQPPPNISYSAERIIGNGSFGVVFEAKVVETGEIVAIKKVLQDKRFKNRELQIMRQLVKDPHPNIVQLQHCFYSQGEKPDELYLNLVLEFVPETVYSINRRHQKHSIPLPLIHVKLYMYQLCRALAHIHCLGICHRDIKPQNLLVHPVTQQLKLCDFGSAKALIHGEPNVSYICSRYYRAPELIFGSTDYTTAIDIWSQGCVGAELLLGQPLFPGESGVDQLVEIIKVLGTPTKEEIRSMNSNYMEFKFPQIKGCQWKKIFRNKTPDDAVAFIASNLAYTPSKRLHPLEGCAHVFFDELRQEHTTLPNNGGPLPPLFNFTMHELQHTALMSQLIPEYILVQQNTSTLTTHDPPYSAATSTTTSTTASPSMHSIQHPPYQNSNNNDESTMMETSNSNNHSLGDDQKMSAR